jgi:hypothetical protein
MNRASLLLPSLPDPAPLPGAVLFGFDNRAFPFQQHVQTHLIPARRPEIALPRGPAGSHDEIVRFYGSVVRVDDTFHLWYFGGFGEEPGRQGYGHGLQDCVLCYARSRDGLHWEKPDLGLVAFRGSTRNNIVDLPHPGFRPACAVLHDPDDPDPARRFKMAYEAPIEGRPGQRFCVAFSPDGLRWTPSGRNPVGPFFEMAGIAWWRGLYYVTGQASLTGHRPLAARRLCTFVSADFEHWSPCSAMGLERTEDRFGPSMAADQHQYEEVHLGATLWNRGNVLLGVYGQWHGHRSGDRRLLTMDLGLALSHDALHFHEPIPDFRLVPAREQPGTPAGAHPALMQGQGFEQVGDRTLFWYACWLGPNAAGVLAASWERDRLGMLQPFRPDQARAITCPIQALQGTVSVHANVSGLGPHSCLRIELLDQGFRPLTGFSGEDGAVVAEDGLRVPVRWPSGAALRPDRERMRLGVRFEGVRPEDCRLHALYLGEGD